MQRSVFFETNKDVNENWGNMIRTPRDVAKKQNLRLEASRERA